MAHPLGKWAGSLNFCHASGTAELELSVDRDNLVRVSDCSPDHYMTAARGKPSRRANSSGFPQRLVLENGTNSRSYRYFFARWMQTAYDQQTNTTSQFR